MKKDFKYCSSIIALGTLMFFAGCSNSTTKRDADGKETKTVKVDSLPSNPKDQQRYTDSNGHSWIYDYAMARWMLSGIDGGGNTYYYYPSTGNYSDQTGKTVTPPSTVSTGISNGVKARTEPVTVTKTTTSSVSTKSTSTTSSKGKSVFGSTGRSHSISA